MQRKLKFIWLLISCSIKKSCPCVTWIHLLWIILILIFDFLLFHYQKIYVRCWSSAYHIYRWLGFPQDYRSLEELPSGLAWSASNQFRPGSHGPEVNDWLDVQWLHFSIWIWYLHTTFSGKNWGTWITWNVSQCFKLDSFPRTKTVFYTLNWHYLGCKGFGHLALHPLNSSSNT